MHPQLKIVTPEPDEFEAACEAVNAATANRNARQADAAAARGELAANDDAVNNAAPSKLNGLLQERGILREKIAVLDKRLDDAQAELAAASGRYGQIAQERRHAEFAAREAVEIADLKTNATTIDEAIANLATVTRARLPLLAAHAATRGELGNEPRSTEPDLGEVLRYASNRAGQMGSPGTFELRVRFAQ